MAQTYTPICKNEHAPLIPAVPRPKSKTDHFEFPGLRTTLKCPYYLCHFHPHLHCYFPALGNPNIESSHEFINEGIGS